jgi:hypothetical protein
MRGVEGGAPVTDPTAAEAYETARNALVVARAEYARLFGIPVIGPFVSTRAWRRVLRATAAFKEALDRYIEALRPPA